MNRFAGVLRPRVKPAIYVHKPVYYRDREEDKEKKKPRRSRSNEAGRRVARCKSVDSAPVNFRRSQSSPRAQPTPHGPSATNAVERLALSNALLFSELSRMRSEAAVLVKRDQANRKLIDELSAECSQLRNEVKLLTARSGT